MTATDRAQIKVYALLLTAALAAADPLPAFAQEPHEFAITAADATRAIHDFGAQSGLQILASADQLKGKRLNPITGTHSTDSGLKILLAGTGLTHRYVGERTVALVQDNPNPSPGIGSDQPLSPEGGGQGEGQQGARDSGKVRDTADEKVNYESQEIAEIVVTGTYIRGAAPAGSPLTVFTQEQIQRTGSGSVSEFLRKVPQNFANVDGYNSQLVGGNSDTSYNMNGGTSVNLRGLGAGATLTLINGHRIAAAGLYGTTPDVSAIPLGAIERVEVLGDGASSIYGADAIAGVVNFVLRKDYDGAELGLRYGDSTQGGGQEMSAAATLGHSFGDGSVLMSYERYVLDPYVMGQRDLGEGIFPGSDDTFLGPSQRRHSLFLAANRNLGERTALSAEVLLGDRRFNGAYFDSFSAQIQEGRAQSLSANVSLTHDLGRAWRAKIDTGTARIADRLESSITFGGVPLPPSQFRNTANLYSLDLSADGPVWELPGGNMRLAVGAGGRRERFVVADISTVFEPDTLERNVFSAFGELAVPLIGERNRGRLRALDLSLSARYDHYDDFGSAFSPKFGVTLVPVDGLSLRASLARSFRAPPLNQLTALNLNYAAFPLPDPQAPGGVTNTVFDFSSGNPGLDAEKSQSFTAGFDLRPPGIPRLSVTATYFRISYRDRIANPPFPDGNFFGLFSVPGVREAVGPFLQMPADPAIIAAIYASGRLNNSSAIDEADVGAFFDARFQNIGRSLSKGVDLSLDYALPLAGGTVSPFASVTYLSASDYRAIAAAASVSQLNQVSFPVDFRARGGLTFERRGYSVTATANYADGYANRQFVPFGGPELHVASWTTVDLQFAYVAPADRSGLLGGTRMAVNMQNAWDTAPPRVTGPFGSYGFDAANASALGRFLSLQLTRSW